MAEILIKAIDYVHDAPEIDRQAAFKAGYPVVVMEKIVRLEKFKGGSECP